MPETTPAAGLAAAVALVSATHQMLDGQLADEEYGRLAHSILADTWPADPEEGLRAVAYIAVRAASLAAAASDSSIELILGFLGSEVASLPE